jgi:hypothetical protein
MVWCVAAGGQSTAAVQVFVMFGRGPGGGGSTVRWRRGGLMGWQAGGGHVGRIARISAVALSCVALANCSASKVLSDKFSDKSSQRVVAEGEPVPKGGGV